VPKIQWVGWRRNREDFGEMARFLIPQLGERRRVSGNLLFQQSGVTPTLECSVAGYQASGIAGNSLEMSFL
jgi:ribosome modulation factor